MKWFKGTLRFFLVTVGIIVLTSLTIDATDSFRTSQTALGILAGNVSLVEGCPDGTLDLSIGEETWCVDRYENSPSAECPEPKPQSNLHTEENLRKADCQAESKVDALPWTNVTFHQAKELCARRGMQLPTNAQWYELALGTDDSLSACNLDSARPDTTGSHPQCQSARGVYDAVGNVWEWVDARVESGLYQNRTLPTEGFVLEADVDGVALLTTSTPQTLMHDDYFWSETTGSFAMMRGGYHGSKQDGGIYSIYAKVTPSFSSGAIGFRCLKRQ